MLSVAESKFSDSSRPVLPSSRKIPSKLDQDEGSFIPVSDQNDMCVTSIDLSKDSDSTHTKDSASSPT